MLSARKEGKHSCFSWLKKSLLFRNMSYAYAYISLEKCNRISVYLYQNFFSRASRKQFHFLLLHMFWFSKAKDKLKKLAHETLVMLLTKYVIRSHFCQMCLEEMPWKSQMNIYLALAHYHLCKKNLEGQYNIGISGSQHLDRYLLLHYQWLLLIEITVLLLLLQRDLNYNVFIWTVQLSNANYLFLCKKFCFPSCGHQAQFWLLTSLVRWKLWNILY